MTAPDPAAAGSGEGALQEWRQGDCVLGEQWFAHRFDPATPLTPEAAALGPDAGDLVETEVLGLVVISQTCDIVRAWVERPYVEVAPLVEVGEDVLRDIDRGRRPAYAVVPALMDQRLVADLDRTMTLEKPVLTARPRVVGCRTDPEMRRFAQALARKRARFAFPDDFTAFARKLQDRLSGKHDKESPEGRALRALREVRVRAAPSWDAEQVNLTFWFVRDDDDPDVAGAPWHQHLEQWLKLVEPQGRFGSVDGAVQTLDDMTARDLVESDPVDLDHLSTRI